MCADALAISVSTLHYLTLSHSRATKFFMPGECKVNQEIETKRPNIATLKDVAAKIVAERPDAEVMRTLDIRVVHGLGLGGHETHPRQ